MYFLSLFFTARPRRRRYHHTTSTSTSTFTITPSTSTFNSFHFTSPVCQTEIHLLPFPFLHLLKRRREDCCRGSDHSKCKLKLNANDEYDDDDLHVGSPSSPFSFPQLLFLARLHIILISIMHANQPRN